MPKKSWQEKLYTAHGLPKVEPMDERMVRRLGPGTLLVPAPFEIDEVMRSVGSGETITTDEIRARLAAKHGATTACPLVTGISVRIAACAAEEREREGKGPVTPYWRTLKTGGELNDKLPGGIEHQKLMLELEGHTIRQQGKRFFVESETIRS